MGQSLVGGLIGGAGGAIQGFISGGPAGALALGAIGFVGGFASSYMAKQATADALSSAMGGGEPKFGGYNVNRRGAALHHQVVYGQTKIGGVVVFDDAHGTNNKNLSRIIAYAGHEIESFEKIYMGRYELTLSGDNVTSAQEIDENGNAVGSSTNKFNSYIKVRQVTGGHTDSLNGSFPSFSSEWTSAHKLLGIAHLAIVFTYADDVWEEGLPEVTALIKGKKVYDPRTTTTTWSDNPALIVRDFLTNSVYGLAEATTNIDDTLVSTAANICEETIYPFLTDAVDIVSSTDYKIHTVGTTDFTAIGAANNNVGTVFTATGAGTGTGTAGKIEANVDKYTCNGAWTTSQAPVDVIAQLMTSCAGYLWYAQGKWRMKAGKYVAPTVTLTEDDLRSPISVATRHSRRDNFNAVRGTFRGPSTNYQFTDYPTVTASAFVTTDGGLESTMDLALPFTDTPEEAQRLANIALEKNRSQITITGSFGLSAFSLQVGDNVSITNTRFGWTDKLFEVVAWSLSVEDYQLNVNLVLRETTTTTYDEFQNIAVFESDNTNLPGALGDPATGVNETNSATGLTAEGGLRQIKLSWSNPVNNNYYKTEVEKTNSISGIVTSYEIGEVVGGESFIDVGGLTGDQIDTNPFSSNPTYATRYYRVRAVDSNGDVLTGGDWTDWAAASLKRSDTDDVVNNAITNSQSGELTSSTDIAGPFSDTTIAQTAQFTATGENVLVSWDALISETFSGDPRIRFDLKRSQSGNDGTLQTFNNVVVALRETYSGSYLDEDCNAGSVRYELVAECQTSGSGDMTAEAAHLSATEVKR